MNLEKPHCKDLIDVMSTQRIPAKKFKIFFAFPLHLCAFAVMGCCFAIQR